MPSVGHNLFQFYLVLILFLVHFGSIIILFQLYFNCISIFININQVYSISLCVYFVFCLLCGTPFSPSFLV